MMKGEGHKRYINIPLRIFHISPHCKILLNKPCSEPVIILISHVHLIVHVRNISTLEEVQFWEPPWLGPGSGCSQIHVVKTTAPPRHAFPDVAGLSGRVCRHKEKSGGYSQNRFRYSEAFCTRLAQIVCAFFPLADLCKHNYMSDLIEEDNHSLDLGRQPS